MARTETVTVVFTDLVGSTELASRLGHDAYEALRQEHFTALRTAVTKHGGTEVKTTGDGLMLRFDSATNAIACAVALQQATDSKVRRNDPVQIRIGASSGEATQESSDLFGPPVVEAARLCTVAAAGQILVSEVVRLMARGHGHTFTSLGELTLKGLPEPVASFEVEWEPLAAGLPLPPRLATKPALAMFGRGAFRRAGCSVGEVEGRPASIGPACRRGGDRQDAARHRDGFGSARRRGCGAARHVRRGRQPALSTVR
jgi:class 3 adenylate cyclase